MTKNLPNLKIVSLSNLVLHEDVDPNRVKRLAAKIKKDDIFTNPPVVAPISKSGKFVVLDGANRTTVFRQLGFKDILVQVIDYQQPGLELKTWNHLVAGIKARDFFSQIKKMVSKPMAKKFKLRGNKIVCRPIKKKDFFTQIEALNKIVDLYAKRYKFYRLDNASDFSVNGENKTLIVFPKFTPQDIILVAEKNLKVPSGITRHLVSGRALRIDLPIVILKSSKGLTWKNQQLQNLIKKRFEENKIRHYQEPIFIFND
ncbi:MAG: ParB N-terminal domain-containing protein [Patescibacteria group bacterium]|jgi:hypothetical protein